MKPAASSDRLDEAIAAFEDASSRSMAILGPDHPRALANQGNLAVMYEKAGRLVEAIALHERVVRGMEAALGPDHQEAMVTRDNLGAAYREAGRIGDAVAVHEETARRFEAAFGPDHPGTLTSKTNLAAVYLLDDRVREAIALHQEVLRGRELALGPDHFETIASMNNLVHAYRTSGDDERLIAILRRLLPAQRRTMSIDDTRPADTLDDHAGALLRLGRSVEAEPIAREGLALHRRIEPDSWYTFRSMGLLGEALLGLARFDDAEPLLLGSFEGLAAREDSLLESDRASWRAEVADRLVRLFEATDRPEIAARWRAERGGAGDLPELPADPFARPLRAPPPSD